MEEWNLGSLRQKSQGNHGAACLVERLKCKWTSQINYFGSHSLTDVDSLKAKSCIMSPRWHLGLIYVGTGVAIKCTCVPRVAPFQTEHVYRDRKRGWSRSTPATAVSTASQIQVSRICTLPAFSMDFHSSPQPGTQLQEISGWWMEEKWLIRWNLLH